MRLLLIFLLIVYAACETPYRVYNINYNTQYFVDIIQFPQFYIPKANLYFIVPVENLGATNLQITLSKVDKIDFKVKVSGFFQNPTESEIVNGTDYIELEQREISTLSDRIVYTYTIPTLKKQEKIKYLVFTILNNEPLSFLSVYVYSAKEEVEFTVYNITYKKEEILNKTTLSKHKGVFLFILENEDLENNKLVKLKLKKELSKDMQAGVAGFKEKPLTLEIIKKPVVFDELLIESSRKDGNYTIYESHIKNAEINKQKYIAIAMFPDESFDFMSLYIGPES